MKRRYLPLLLAVLAPTAFAATPYVGETDHTTATGQELYMMLSCYKLEPYRRQYLCNALPALARTGVHGILYSAIGGISANLAAKGAPELDEVAYNRSIYKQAKDVGAHLWLQLPEYYNRVTVDGVARTVTADEIIHDDKPGGAREAFERELLREFEAYSEFAPADDCRVIAFEEAGIYHSAQGGGTFWASPKPLPKGPDAEYDALFAEHLQGVFGLVHEWISGVNPRCKIGVHLGHQAAEDTRSLPGAFALLAKAGCQPAFVLYDLYLGPSAPTPSRWENYQAKLTARRANLAALNPQTPVPVLHLAQLHTTNNFGHGLGFTPSRKELDDTVALDGKLKLDGVGYYTKNAVQTDPATSPEAYDPNTVGAVPGEESSTDRWDYGLAQLFEKKTVDYRDWFDLVLYGKFSADGYQVFAQRANSDQWDLIGYADRTLRNESVAAPHAVVFRFLPAPTYLAAGRTELKLKLVPTPGFPEGVLTKAYIVPSRPSGGFRAAREIEADILSGKVDAYARASAAEPIPLGVVAAGLTLTVR